MRRDIGSLPVREQRSKWRDALALLSLRDETIATGPLSAEVEVLHSLSGAIFAHLRSSNWTLAHTADETSRGTAFILFHYAGRGSFIDGPSFTESTISLCDGAAPWRMIFREDFDVLIVKLPRARIAERLGRARSFPVVLGESIPALAAQSMMKTLLTEFEGVLEADLVSAEIALAELVAAALPRGGGPEGSGVTQVQAAHFHRVTTAIEARLSQPELSMRDVALKEGMSQRYLQKLFELQGTTFSDFVRGRRLERARLDLIDTAHSMASIAEIAFRWGFRDQGHFSRAFRTAYGLSPRAYRGTPSRFTTEEERFRGRPIGKSGTESTAHDDVGARHMVELADVSETLAPARVLNRRHVAVNCDTVHWGFLSRDIPPVLRVPSGTEVVIETLTQHASDDYERMIKGDAGAESVFHWTAEGKNVERRGAGPMDASILGRGAGEGFGVHILTGPIYIDGAEPGDVLEVQILDVASRPSENPDFQGRCFASNASTWWGYQYSDLIDPEDRREVVTIFEIEPGEDWARAVYSFRWTPQTDPYGIRHDTIDYPGVPVDHSTIEKRHEPLQNVRVPLRPHFGCMAVAPKENSLVDSIPPGSFGGNFDNWRAGKGSTLYLPVAVPGALFSVGDGHLTLGDGEINGTALEGSLTGTFRFTLHKSGAESKPYLRGLCGPLLETPEEFVLHGFSYPDYLRDLGQDAQAEVYKRSSLDRALRSAYRVTRKFLMDAWELDEDEASTLMSLAVDFGVTQVADGNWGTHAIIRKSLFR